MAEPLEITATVKDGRFISDSKTDLPEGTKVRFVDANSYTYADEWNKEDMDPKEKAALDKCLDEAWQQAERGECSTLPQVLKRLRALR